MNRYDTIGRRIVALLVDLAVFLPLIVLTFVLAERELPLPWEVAWLVVSAMSGIAYNVLFHWRFGQTVGKMVAKVKVVSLSEDPLSL